MHRLMDIKDKLEVIESALNKQYPHFRGDPEITELVTELKDFVQGEDKKIQKQLSRDELSEFESAFIAPAINDVYLNALDRVRRGSKPSNEMNNRIYETSSTLSYWLFQIEDYKKKKLNDCNT